MFFNHGTADQAGQLVSALTGLTSSEPRIAVLEFRKAPIVLSGDNIYIAWWTNKTGNYEVNFRASTDGGGSFGDKINLSNSTDAD